VDGLQPDTGKREAVVDGMWLLTLAINGLVGVVTLTTAILLPTILLRKRVPPAWWGHPFAAPATAWRRAASRCTWPTTC
jgi:hypothetical protein